MWNLFKQLAKVAFYIVFGFIVLLVVLYATYDAPGIQ